MQHKNLKENALTWYLLLAAMFIAALVACNLIFIKFFYWQPLAFLHNDNSFWSSVTAYTFVVSVGIIPYPITFLITDVLSEIYGRKRANRVVTAGLIASLFTVLIVYIAILVPATDFSVLSDAEFEKVFGNVVYGVGASMIAYLLAQYVDIRIFHFWKTLTKGKHLWLRNNFSTIPSQMIDTLTILLILCGAGTLKWEQFFPLLINGFLFKVIIAAIDTPFFYLMIWWFRKKFNLKEGEEVEL